MRYIAELRFGRLGKTAELKFSRLLNVITQTKTEVVFIHVHLFTLNFFTFNKTMKTYLLNSFLFFPDI